MPHELSRSFQRVVPEAPSRPQGGGRRRHGDREALAALAFQRQTVRGSSFQQHRSGPSAGPPAFHGVDEVPDPGSAAPPGPRRIRHQQRVGLRCAIRLREREGCEEGDLTGPNPVSEASNGSKFHLIMERTGPLLSIGISGANVHARVWYPPRPDAVGRPSCTSTRRTPTGLCAAGSGQEKNPCLRRRATRPTASTPTTTTQRRLVETSGTPRVPGCGRSRYSPRPGL